MLAFLFSILLAISFPDSSKPHLVRARVTPSETAVYVEVVIDNGEYFRASSISLRSDQKTYWVDWRDVPSGIYVVVAAEMDRDGNVTMSTPQNVVVR